MDKSPARPVQLGRRVPLISVLIASGALLVAACGSSPNSTAVAHLGATTTTSGSSAQGGSPPATSNGPGQGGGSGPSAGSGSSGPQSKQVFGIPNGNEAASLAFAECMRSHGVANFPDPNAQGGIQATGLDVGSPTFQAAANHCRHLLPNGGQPTPAQQAKALAQALKFSQCMRSHGIADFPDPQSQPGGGISISLHASPGSNLNPNGALFQAAQKACKGLSPLGGAPG
jgi:hypothetical protein